jgi:hypothetical protein
VAHSLIRIERVERPPVVEAYPPKVIDLLRQSLRDRFASVSWHESRERRRVYKVPRPGPRECRGREAVIEGSTGLASGAGHDRAV